MRRFLSTLTLNVLFVAAASAQLPHIHHADGASPGDFWGASSTFAGDWRGRGLKACDDIDGDGVVDVLIGASGERVILLSGATGASLLTLTPPASGEGFGLAFCQAGDQDGDGTIDVAVGAPNAPGPQVIGGMLDPNAPLAGKVYVFSGATGAILETWTAPVSPAVQLNFPTALRFKGRFGSDLCHMGDLDGDGIDEVAVSGHTFALTPLLQEGSRVQIISGATASALIELPAGGYRICRVDDIDGDGKSDIAASTPGFTFGIAGGFVPPDRVDVYSTSTGANLASFSGPTPTALYDGLEFGHGLSRAGDLDGDGIDELLIGIPRHQHPSYPFQTFPLEGSVRVYSLATGQLLRSHTLGSAGLDEFGSSVTGGVDYDGDGVPDYAAGVRLHDRVYLYSGATGAEIEVFDSPGALEWFGNHVVMLPDVSGDGLPDLAASAPLQNGMGGFNSGRISFLSPRGALVYGDDGAPGQTLSIQWQASLTHPSRGDGKISGAAPFASGAALAAFESGSTQFGGVHVLVDVSIPSSLFIFPVTFYH